MRKTTNNASFDKNTTLCLACSSSLPPLKAERNTDIFIARCCSRPICPACILSNPRLARYDPCLACLSGVGLVSGGRHGKERSNRSANHDPSRNIDGGIRDEDTFVLGDDEEDDEEEDEDDEIEQEGSAASKTTPPAPLYTSTAPSQSSPERPSIPDTQIVEATTTNSEGQQDTATNPLEYYIKSGDTLQGIALRFSVNGRELCRINSLPASTLSTAPHILHTRSKLTLPPSARAKLQGQLPQCDDQVEIERKARRARERAEKRLQTLTKEVDWRIAKAYVALADDPGEAAECGIKHKESSKASDSAGEMNLEGRSIQRYLDDEEWEERERREGRGVSIPRFPFVNTDNQGGKGEGRSKWWTWNN